MPDAEEIKDKAKQSLEFVKDTASGKQKPAQGTRFVYAPLILVTCAFALSVLALASCQFVIYSDPTLEDPELSYRTTGIYCYDSSLREKIQNFFIGSLQVFVQIIGTITAIVGGFATLILWRAIKKPHGRCIFRTLACCVIFCVPGQFATLSMLQADFCWNWSQIDNNCTLGWGGNVSIASGCLYCVSICALCMVPSAREFPGPDEDAAGDDEEAQAGEKKKPFWKK